MRSGPSVGPHRSGPMPDWAAASTTLTLLAGKWVVAALSVLARGPRRHAAVQKSIGSGISDKVLIDTLRRMQRNGLLTRQVQDSGGQVAVIYALTPRGRSLLDPVMSLARWAHEQRPGPQPGPGRPQK
jgi:DNA-binding HxlR family transcriptional regulator